MSRKILDNYLQVVGHRIGKKLFLDPNGICVLQKDDDESQGYVIELPRNSQVIYFYAPVCRVPYGCSEEFFEKILEFNLCGITYNQATFGLDTKTQNIVISYTRSMESLDEIAFVNITCNFIKTVDRARKDLQKLVQKLIGELSFEDEDFAEEVKQRHRKFGINEWKV